VSDVDIESVNENVKFFTGVYKYNLGYRNVDCSLFLFFYKTNGLM